MVGTNDSKRNEALLECLSSLPRKIIAIHELDNLPEFILHDICSETCFNLHKAAYFVDNPDFNTCKGVAGFCSHEACDVHNQLWQDPASFSAFMQESPFNKQVRAMLLESVVRNKLMHEDVVNRIAQQLGFMHPAWCTWHLKHFNDGLIVYEKADLDDTAFDQHFLNTLHLLGFCAIR